MTRKALRGLALPNAWVQPGFHQACTRLYDPKRVYPRFLAKILHHVVNAATVLRAHSMPCDSVMLIVPQEAQAEVGRDGEDGHIAAVDDAARAAQFLGIVTAGVNRRAEIDYGDFILWCEVNGFALATVLDGFFGSGGHNLAWEEQSPAYYMYAFSNPSMWSLDVIGIRTGVFIFLRSTIGSQLQRCHQEHAKCEHSCRYQSEHRLYTHQHSYIIRSGVVAALNGEDDPSDSGPKGDPPSATPQPKRQRPENPDEPEPDKPPKGGKGKGKSDD